MIDFVARNWGNLASVVGLILAGASAYFARRASAAAEQARKAILSSTLAEEISIAAKLAGEITELIDFGKHEIARLRCGDLHDKTVMILKRWDADLSEESMPVIIRDQRAQIGCELSSPCLPKKGLLINGRGIRPEPAPAKRIGQRFERSVSKNPKVWRRCSGRT